MEDNPVLISVYIITHNRRKLLERSLKSVREQIYKRLEIIIVDDYSTDDTSLFVKRQCEEDSRIIYIRNDQNKGACFSRNAAIEVATGEFITGLDDDDYFLPERVSDFYQSKNIINNDICLLYTDSIWKTAYGMNKPKLNTYLNFPVSYEDLLAFNFIGNQVFIKTKILKKYKFDVQMPAWQDLECWINILKGENAKGLKIKKYNYVQDISHEHERISTSKHDKIHIAYKNINLKYKLSAFQAALLLNHFSSYGCHSIKSLLSNILIVKRFKYHGLLIAGRNIKEMFKKR